MEWSVTPGEMSRAAGYLAQVNMAIIKAAGARRQGHVSRGAAIPGARPPASIAAGPVQRRVIMGPSPGGGVETKTPVGYKTAVRTLPRMLGALAEADPRRRAALALADAAERIGASKGLDLTGSAPKSALSDGGATTRVKHAARLRRMEALANGWAVTAAGKVERGQPRIALEVGRQTGGLQEIKAFDALLAMCRDGLSGDEILRRHGWAAKSNARKKLGAALLAALDDMADGLGFGRWEKKTP